MSEPEEQKESFQILSARSMKDRKSLLLVSTIILVMKFANLIPIKISALGIVLSPANKNTIFVSLGIILLYFFISFLLNAFGEFISFNVKTKIDSIEKNMHNLKVIRDYYPGTVISHDREIIPDENKGEYKTLESLHDITLSKFQKKVKRIVLSKKIFEFYFPIFGGIFALSVLFFK